MEGFGYFLLGGIVGAAGGFVGAMFLSKNKGGFVNFDRRTTETLSEVVQNKDEEKLKECNQEIIKLQGEIQKLKSENRKMREAIDDADDDKDDAEDEVRKLKNSNKRLTQELDKLKLDLEEYERLYNRAKTELESYKKQ